MSCEEVLKAVFPLLEGTDLASCMGVSKQWREIAQDDYMWKCACAKRWPSIWKRPSPPTATYYKLFQTFNKEQQWCALLPPRLSFNQRLPFNDLECYVDIWTEERLIFSEVVPGPVLQKGINMTLPMEPRFTFPWSQKVSVSVLVGRKDSNKIACIIDKLILNYPFVCCFDPRREGAIDDFGIEMVFCDAANSVKYLLWLFKNRSSYHRSEWDLQYFWD
ncbi:hypothetical protein U1Q18_028419 [Sarracenia purpurea var. burkii]